MNGWIGVDLGDLALFASVVDHGGFTAAALRTGIPQSTISRRVGALETRMGVRLLDRTTRHIRLTEAGQRAHDHARLMMAAGAAAMSTADMSRAAPSGLLRVSAPVALAQSVVPDAVRCYMHRYPDVSVSLEFTTRSLDPVEDNIDVAVRVGMPERSMASVHKLFSARHGVFVAPSFSGPIPSSPEDVASCDVFGVMRGPVQASLTFTREDRVVTADVTLRLRCNGIRAVIDAAETCNGLALLPEFAAPADWRQIWKEWTLPASDVIALTTRHFRLLPRVAAFIDILRNEVAAAAPTQRPDAATTVIA
jgi:DNA-binding transcriptional LysR family regulator